MDLAYLSDNVLHKNTERLVQHERDNLIRLLHHLREIERRRLFSKFKCQSLHEYMTIKLKYSTDDAVRRISAMRLLREVPEVEVLLKNGSLNLTNLNLAQTLFNKERKAGRKYSPAQKREVLARFENQSTRQARKIATEINPDMKMGSQLTYDGIEDDSLREKLLQVKGLFAHSDPGLSLAELLHKLCDLAIAEKNKSPAAARVDSIAEIYRENWRRGGGKCAKCSSTHAVQHDHIIPLAAGGETTLENLRLLCRNCNLRAAIEFYGRFKMENYVREPVQSYSVAHRGVFSQ